jgi:hypothetical protein
MISILGSRPRGTLAFVLSLPLVLSLPACCEPHPVPPTVASFAAAAPMGGEVVVDPASISNPTKALGTGGGSNPKVYGRTRFQGSLVRFDVQVLESSPAQVDRVDLRWVSHNDAALPVFPTDAQASYLINPRQTRWYVFSIPATWDSTAPNDCLHIQAELFTGTTSLGTVKQKFTPVVDAAWGFEWAH